MATFTPLAKSRVLIVNSGYSVSTFFRVPTTGGTVAISETQDQEKYNSNESEIRKRACVYLDNVMSGWMDEDVKEGIPLGIAIHRTFVIAGRQGAEPRWEVSQFTLPATDLAVPRLSAASMLHPRPHHLLTLETAGAWWPGFARYWYLLPSAWPCCFALPRPTPPSTALPTTASSPWLNLFNRHSGANERWRQAFLGQILQFGRWSRVTGASSCVSRSGAPSDGAAVPCWPCLPSPLRIRSNGTHFQRLFSDLVSSFRRRFRVR